MCLSVLLLTPSQRPALLSAASLTYHQWLSCNLYACSLDSNGQNKVWNRPSLEHFLSPLRLCFPEIVSFAQINSSKFCTGWDFLGRRGGVQDYDVNSRVGVGSAERVHFWSVSRSLRHTGSTSLLLTAGSWVGNPWGRAETPRSSLCWAESAFPTRLCLKYHLSLNCGWS